jgi:hypothetical protein
MFTKEDFKNQINQTKIQVIIMDRLGFDISTSYHDLSKRDQRRFETEQNAYLNSPPFKTDDWEEELNELSGEIVKSFIDGKKATSARYADSVAGSATLDAQMVFRTDEEKYTFEENERIQRERYNELMRKKLSDQESPKEILV